MYFHSQMKKFQNDIYYFICNCVNSVNRDDIYSVLTTVNKHSTFFYQPSCSSEANMVDTCKHFEIGSGSVRSLSHLPVFVIEHLCRAKGSTNTKQIKKVMTLKLYWKLKLTFRAEGTTISFKEKPGFYFRTWRRQSCHWRFRKWNK